MRDKSIPDAIKKLQNDSRINNGSDVTYIVTSIAIVVILVLDYIGFMSTHKWTSGLDHIPPLFLFIVLIFIWLRIITRITKSKKLLRSYNNGSVTLEDIKANDSKLVLPFGTDYTPWYKAKPILWILLIVVLLGLILGIKLLMNHLRASGG